MNFQYTKSNGNKKKEKIQQYERIQKKTIQNELKSIENLKKKVESISNETIPATSIHDLKTMPNEPIIANIQHFNINNNIIGELSSNGRFCLHPNFDIDQNNMVVENPTINSNLNFTINPTMDTIMDTIISPIVDTIMNPIMNVNMNMNMNTAINLNMNPIMNMTPNPIMNDQSINNNNGNHNGNNNGNHNGNHNSDDIKNAPNIDTMISVLKTKIHTICHVYQESFINKKASGLGDYIRGSIFISQFCDLYGFQSLFHMNHLLNNFTKNKTVNPIKRYPPFSAFIDSNWSCTEFKENGGIQDVFNKKYFIFLFDFIYFMYKAVLKNENCILFRSNGNVGEDGKGIFLINTIAFPFLQIQKKHCLKIIDLFHPNDFMDQYLIKIMNHMQLIKKKYKIIHIRSGDVYLNKSKKSFYSKYVYELINSIKKTITKNPQTSFLLITDNTQIKSVCIHYLPLLKTMFKDITHLGEGVTQEINKVQNTFLDFYLLSQSNEIFSFTSMKHGTGFSRWCAILYDIPYSCFYIDNHI